MNPVSLHSCRSFLLLLVLLGGPLFVCRNLRSQTKPVLLNGLLGDHRYIEIAGANPFRDPSSQKFGEAHGDGEITIAGINGSSMLPFKAPFEFGKPTTAGINGGLILAPKAPFEFGKSEFKCSIIAVGDLTGIFPRGSLGPDGGPSPSKKPSATSPGEGQSSSTPPKPEATPPKPEDAVYRLKSILVRFFEANSKSSHPNCNITIPSPFHYKILIEGVSQAVIQNGEDVENFTIELDFERAFLGSNYEIILQIEGEYGPVVLGQPPLEKRMEKFDPEHKDQLDKLQTKLEAFLLLELDSSVPTPSK
jgi:hypothetical protein